MLRKEKEDREERERREDMKEKKMVCLHKVFIVIVWAIAIMANLFVLFFGLKLIIK
jgi:cell division protein FtsL